jgi:hypothetical protein
MTPKNEAHRAREAGARQHRGYLDFFFKFRYRYIKGECSRRQTWCSSGSVLGVWGFLSVSFTGLLLYVFFLVAFLYMGNGFYLSLFILYFLYFHSLSLYFHVSLIIVVRRLFLLSYLLWFLVCIFGSRFLGVGLSVGFVGADIIRTHFLYILSVWHVGTSPRVHLYLDEHSIHPTRVETAFLHNAITNNCNHLTSQVQRRGYSTY